MTCWAGVGVLSGGCAEELNDFKCLMTQTEYGTKLNDKYIKGKV
jgi:hypothetical protein